MIPLAVALHVHEVSALVAGLVAFAALGLACLGFAAMRRRRNDALRFVSLAFLVFALKNLFAAWALYTRAIPHQHLELGLALADLVVMGLLIAPLVPRLRNARNNAP